jgi:elongation factor P
MKASDLKRGAVVAIEGSTYVVAEIQVKTPSSRGTATLYKVTFRNVVTRHKLDETFRGEDLLQEVEFMRRPVQLLFRESSGCTFMDSESYEQYTLSNEMLEQELPYLLDGLEGLQLLIANDEVVGLALPTTVEMEITECAPPLKGASATARSKPATLTTGLVIQVPEYLGVGERVRVNTETGKFSSRA